MRAILLKIQQLLLLASLAYWGGLSLPLVPTLESRQKGALVTYGDEGQERWRAEWTLEPIALDGQPMVRFTEIGEGQHSPFKVPVRWNLESFWVYGARFSPQRYEKTFTDLKGNPLVTEEFTFDRAKETLRFKRIEHVRHLNTEKVLSVPPDTLTSDGIATALRALPYGSSSPVTIHLLTNEPKLYKVTFEIQGQEKVKTRAGAFICYKV